MHSTVSAVVMQLWDALLDFRRIPRRSIDYQLSFSGIAVSALLALINRLEAGLKLLILNSFFRRFGLVLVWLSLVWFI